MTRRLKEAAIRGAERRVIAAVQDLLDDPRIRHAMPHESPRCKVCRLREAIQALPEMKRTKESTSG